MFGPDIRNLTVVKRWGILRTLQSQNVAEHSYMVAVYAQQIAAFCGWKGDMGQLLAHALWHDADEVITGDIPGPTKRNMHLAPRFDDWLRTEAEARFGTLYAQHGGRKVPDDIRAIVKIADLIDECLFLKTEEELGNASIPSSVMVNSKARCFGAIQEALSVGVFTDPADSDDLWNRILDSLKDNVRIKVVLG